MFSKQHKNQTNCDDEDVVVVEQIKEKIDHEHVLSKEQLMQMSQYDKYLYSPKQ